MLKNFSKCLSHHFSSGIKNVSVFYFVFLPLFSIPKPKLRNFWTKRKFKVRTRKSIIPFVILIPCLDVYVTGYGQGHCRDVCREVTVLVVVNYGSVFVSDSRTLKFVSKINPRVVTKYHCIWNKRIPYWVINYYWLSFFLSILSRRVAKRRIGKDFSVVISNWFLCSCLRFHFTS